MNAEARKNAKAFLKEYRLEEVTLEDLRRIITAQGYTIVEFNHIMNDAPVAALIDALNLQETVEKSRGFTYADSNRRLVFVHEDLSEQEKRLVLAHEEGHIYCDHFSALPVIGRDVVEEHEANEFTHYILNRNGVGRFGAFVRKRKLVLAFAAVAVAAVAIGLAVFFGSREEKSDTPAYYLTATGNKYHQQECIFVKNKTDARQMTAQELESGFYEPCGICLPPETGTQ